METQSSETVQLIPSNCLAQQDPIEGLPLVSLPPNQKVGKDEPQSDLGLGMDVDQAFQAHLDDRMGRYGF